MPTRSMRAEVVTVTDPSLRLRGKIDTLKPNYGFIRADGTHYPEPCYFFLPSNMQNGSQFKMLTTMSWVEFTPATTERGVRAVDIVAL